MRIGIASAGPSLITRRHTLASCDFLIAVNAAIEHVDADYWCFGDFPVYGMFTIPKGPPKRDPILFVGQNVMDHIHKEPCWPQFNNHRRMLWTALKDTPLPPVCWDSYSVTAALVLAVNLGANEIHTAGHDMQGDSDFRGKACIGRNEQRWTEERQFWKQTSAWANALGASVTIH